MPSDNLPDELVSAISEHYEPAGLSLTVRPRREAESAEYGACRFDLDGRQVAFRVAKTTPTKVGQFVTLWKRATPDAEIAPLDAGDGVAFVIVSVADAAHRGQFIFDRQTLVERGVWTAGAANAPSGSIRPGANPLPRTRCARSNGNCGASCRSINPIRVRNCDACWW